MRFTAFKSVLTAVVLTAGALGPYTAKAETTLHVPFSFTVAGQTMPAGVYTVKQDTFHNVVILRNQDASKSFAYTLRPGDPAPSEVRVVLRFEISGDSRVLRSIQFGSRETARLDHRPSPSGYDPARLSQGR